MKIRILPITELTILLFRMFYDILFVYTQLAAKNKERKNQNKKWI